MESKIGLLLVGGVEENSPEEDQNAPRFPNEEGRLRCLAAAYALEGLVDEIIPVGGAPDRLGYPSEDGYLDYLKLLLRDSKHQERVHVLPRVKETFETIGDLEEAFRILREQDRVADITIISSNWHLATRMPLILHILKTSAHLLNVEDIYRNTVIERGINPEIAIQKALPLSFKIKYNLREVLLTGVLALDLLPTNRLGTRIIQSVARRTRVG